MIIPLIYNGNRINLNSLTTCNEDFLCWGITQENQLVDFDFSPHMNNTIPVIGLYLSMENHIVKNLIATRSNTGARIRANTKLTRGQHILTTPVIIKHSRCVIAPLLCAGFYLAYEGNGISEIKIDLHGKEDITYYKTSNFLENPKANIMICDFIPMNVYSFEIYICSNGTSNISVKEFSFIGKKGVRYD